MQGKCEQAFEKNHITLFRRYDSKNKYTVSRSIKKDLVQGICHQAHKYFLFLPANTRRQLCERCIRKHARTHIHTMREGKTVDRARKKLSVVNMHANLYTDLCASVLKFAFFFRSAMVSSDLFAPVKLCMHNNK